MSKKQEQKLFTNPKWHQDPGAKVIATGIELTEEQKKRAEEHKKEWAKILEKLKKKRDTQK